MKAIHLFDDKDMLVGAVESAIPQETIYSWWDEYKFKCNFKIESFIGFLVYDRVIADGEVRIISNTYEYNGFRAVVIDNILYIMHKEHGGESVEYKISQTTRTHATDEYFYIDLKGGSYIQVKFEEHDQGVALDLFKTEDGEHLEIIGCYVFGEI